MTTSPIYGNYTSYGTLQIIDIRKNRNPIICSYLGKPELYDILRALDIDAPKIGFLQNLGLDEDSEYNSRWELAGYSNEELCEIIREKLEEIGHIYNL